MPPQVQRRATRSPGRTMPSCRRVILSTLAAMAEPTAGKGGAKTDGPCPCGSGKSYAECCGPVIAGTRLAATAEELMRARFTAHATRDFGFVHRTYRPTSRQPFVPFAD